MDAYTFKLIRTKLGMNQKEFGVELGYTEKGAQRSVSEMELGKRNIKPATVKLVKFVKAKYQNEKKQ